MLAVPRERLGWADGTKKIEWKSRALRLCRCRALAADAAITGSCPAGASTRRMRRADS
jgi:hypothetical protein